AERTNGARQLGSGRNTISGLKSADPGADFKDARTELMAEELNGGFGFQAALDAVEGQRRNSLRKLSLRDAGLHAKGFNENLTRSADGHRHIVQAHVVEAVETPSLHQMILRHRLQPGRSRVQSERPVAQKALLQG